MYFSLANCVSTICVLNYVLLRFSYTLFPLFTISMLCVMDWIQNYTILTRQSISRVYYMCNCHFNSSWDFSRQLCVISFQLEICEIWNLWNTTTCAHSKCFSWRLSFSHNKVYFSWNLVKPTQLQWTWSLRFQRTRTCAKYRRAQWLMQLPFQQQMGSYIHLHSGVPSDIRVGVLAPEIYQRLHFDPHDFGWRVRYS